MKIVLDGVVHQNNRLFYLYKNHQLFCLLDQVSVVGNSHIASSYGSLVAWQKTPGQLVIWLGKLIIFLGQRKPFIYVEVTHDSSDVEAEL